jgi:hypothetical protein
MERDKKKKKKKKKKRAVNTKLDVRRHHMLTNNEGDVETSWTFPQKSLFGLQALLHALLMPTRLTYWSGYEIEITRQKIK